MGKPSPHGELGTAGVAPVPLAELPLLELPLDEPLPVAGAVLGVAPVSVQ
jgi:hypothetical protein